MFDFLKRKKNSTQETPEVVTTQAPEEKNSPNFFSRLKQGLSKTRQSLSSGIANLFLGKKELNAELFTELETLLLKADVGVPTTERLIQSLTEKLARKELSDANAAFVALKAEMKTMLQAQSAPLIINTEKKPFVILVVGINGSGKTTTIGKLAHYFTENHFSVLLAAGDTFRAAAIEQLQIWGQRNHVPVIAQQTGADTAAVIFDSVDAAKARGTAIVLADTAGRLHTQNNLMAELQKVKRVLTKTDPESPHEILIVLDATLGQNALNQVKQFKEAIGLTGIVLTKLDGTAKGGIIFAIAEQMQVPIRFIGVGEGINDLRPFNPDEFIEALFTD